MMKNIIKENNLETYGQLYKNPNTRFAYEVRDKVLIFDSLKHFLGNINGKRVLDIGFGTGDILLSLAKEGADCYGIEVVDTAIEILQSVSPYNLHLSKNDANCLPFKNGYFDIVVCSHVLEHLNNPQKTLVEISRVLKKGCFAIIGVPGTGIGHSPLHYREYTIDSLKKLVKNWEIIFCGKYGSGVLQKIINSVRKIASFSSGNIKKASHNQKKSTTYKQTSLVNKIYYKFGVPVLLFLLFFDNHLPFSKNSPIEIWVVLKKPK